MAFDISPDETHVVYINVSYTVEIVFADFNGNRLRSIQPDGHLNIHSINCSAADISTICATNPSSLSALSTLQEKDRLEHTNDLNGARTVDMVTVVTIAKDNNFRVWDRSRDKKRTTDRQAKSRRVSLDHQDALFVTGSAGEDSPNIVGVYDVGRLEYRAIRELKVACNANTRFYEADNRSVVMEIYDKFYLFDLEKMDVSIVFLGRVVDTRVFILTKRKQLLVTSRFVTFWQERETVQHHKRLH
ncbi:uncharacterized protein LOC127841866 isoform X3 [Dreissena polymorpha]|uniref:uncharacterized protein LOC127841866 isoform X3 n=1 Tax=Dreissena polymorpha TaxID=45954 RepID=UPI0022654095|nr:uncharacterized protein LOC127841866 isoform X3 [Dreissena polymorpha]